MLDPLHVLPLLEKCLSDPLQDRDEAMEGVVPFDFAAFKQKVVQDLPKCPSAHEFHREPRSSVVGVANVVHRRDTGVLELARRLRLGHEVQQLITAAARVFA